MKYAALDIHQASTTICIRAADGFVLVTRVVPTTQAEILAALRSVRGPLTVVVEEGTLAAWICAALKRHVAAIIVCDPRQVHLLRSGMKTDRNDAAKLSELLRLGAVRPVFHGDAATERLRALVRHYVALTGDIIRVKLRLRALYPSVAVKVTASIYDERVRRHHLVALRRYATHRVRAEALFRQHDALNELLEEARSLVVSAAGANPAYALLQSIPYVGEIRAAILMAAIGTPARFPNLRQYWAYAGLAVRAHRSGEHQFLDGELRRTGGAFRTRGLTMSYSRPLKRVFREIAMSAAAGRGPFRRLFDEALARGLRRPVARTALARKVASVVFAVWRTGYAFDPTRLEITESCPEGASTMPVAERHRRLRLVR